MGLLGNWIESSIMRGRQATQDRAALNTLAQFVNDQNDQQTDAMVQRGKQASALRNVLKSYNPDDTDLGHTLNSMGVDQLEGIMHGMAMNSAMNQAQSMLARNQAMADWYNQRVQASAGEDEAASLFAKNFLNGPQGGAPEDNGAMNAFAPTTGGSMLPGSPAAGLAGFGGDTMTATNGAGMGAGAGTDRVMNAIAGMGRVNPRMAGLMLSKVLPGMMGEEATGRQQFFHANDQPNTYGNWQRIPTGPNSSQLVYNDPDNGQFTPMYDDDGNLVGWGQNDARGRSRFVQYKGDEKVKQATDQDGNPLPGYFITDQGKPIDMRTLMQKQGLSFGPAAGSGPKQTGGGPQYKSKADVVAAFKAGKLTRDQAAKLLNEQFNVPLK